MAGPRRSWVGFERSRLPGHPRVARTNTCCLSQISCSADADSPPSFLPEVAKAVAARKPFKKSGSGRERVAPLRPTRRARPASLLQGPALCFVLAGKRFRLHPATRRLVHRHRKRGWTEDVLSAKPPAPALRCDRRFRLLAETRGRKAAILVSEAAGKGGAASRR